ncbi:MAG: ion transporter [Alphaproteobacteria bacterium]|nr:ion transporter [Alphaproteobacteria bacterium]MBV9540140.1 ion transporter [Alphaproteobacteria bacterium]MBV9903086.1 ion transporter [Alphaproteobacteria bacterium]
MTRVAGETVRRRVYLALEGGRLGGPLGAVVEGVLITLIAANVAAYTLQSMPQFEHAFGHAFAVFELVSLVVFALEYAMRIWTAPEDPVAGERGPVMGRLHYALTPLMLIDFLGFAPAAIAFLLPFLDLRVLRLFRLLRLLKIARYSPALSALASALREERRAIYGSVLLFGCALLLFAAAMHAVEGELQPKQFGTIPDAMWWAVSTLTTVGYGDTVPLTPLGRLVAGLAMVVGLGLVSLPVGIVATSFANSIHRRDFVVTFGMVARVPLFQGLDARTVSDVLEHLRAYTVSAGDIISLHGESAAAIYFVVAGEVDARLPDRTVRFGTGDFFGELADSSETLRNALIVAATPARLLELSNSDFEHLVRMHPGLREQMRGRAYGV